MPFSTRGLSLVNASNNYQVAFDYNVTGLPTTPRLGSIRSYNYYTAVDTMTQVMAPDYFVSSASLFAPDDIIYVAASDGNVVLSVSAVNVGVAAKPFPAVPAVPATVITSPTAGQIVTQTVALAPAVINGGQTYAITGVPPAGMKYIFISGSVLLVFNTTAYNGGGTLTFRYTGAGGAAVSSVIAAGFLGLGASSSATAVDVALGAGAEAGFHAPIVLQAQNAQNAGDSTVYASVTYSIVNSAI